MYLFVGVQSRGIARVAAWLNAWIHTIRIARCHGVLLLYVELFWWARIRASSITKREVAFASRLRICSTVSMEPHPPPSPPCTLTIPSLPLPTIQPADLLKRLLKPTRPTNQHRTLGIRRRRVSQLLSNRRLLHTVSHDLNERRSDACRSCLSTVVCTRFQPGMIRCFRESFPLSTLSSAKRTNSSTTWPAELSNCSICQGH